MQIYDWRLGWFYFFSARCTFVYIEIRGLFIDIRGVWFVILTGNKNREWIKTFFLSSFYLFFFQVRQMEREDASVRIALSHPLTTAQRRRKKDKRKEEKRASVSQAQWGFFPSFESESHKSGFWRYHPLSSLLMVYLQLTSESSKKGKEKNTILWATPPHAAKSDPYLKFSNATSQKNARFLKDF